MLGTTVDKPTIACDTFDRINPLPITNVQDENRPSTAQPSMGEERT